MPKKAPAESPLRPIEANACYPLDVFSAAAGLGKSALREARRAGLKVRRVHGRAFILGRDFLAYLETVDGSDANTP